MRWLYDSKAALRVLFTGADRAVALRAAGAALLVLAGGLLTGAGPLALKCLIDAVGGMRDRPLPVIGFACAYLAAVCGSRLLPELRAALVGTTEQRLFAGLKQRVADHLLHVPLAYHLARQTGSVVQSLEQGISGYQVLVGSLVNSVLPIAVELVTVAVVLAALDQPLLLACFTATALAYLAVAGYGTFRMRDGAEAITEGNLRSHGMLTDSLINIEAVKCFNAERSIGRRYGLVAQALATSWGQWHLTTARLGLALTATFALSMAACLAITLHAAAEGTLSVGGFVLANLYLLQVVRPLEMLGTAARDLTQSLAFIRPLLRILDEPEESRPERPPATLRDTRRPAAISFRNVHFSYEEQKPVLQAFTLEVAAGRHVALVGASGSGKSTLLRLLLRLHELQSGVILVDGQAIHALPTANVRNMFGLVPQDTVLFNDSIGFNIGLGAPCAVQQDIEQAARLAGLHDFICGLPEGYATVVGDRGLKVSGGERQRIAIARAVLRRPRIYVFDEATSMLDSATERSVLSNLRQVSAGCTTLTVAHRLSTARHADEIVVLERGRVVEQGDHASLLARSGVYAGLWEAQQRGSIERASS